MFKEMDGILKEENISIKIDNKFIDKYFFI